MIIYLEKSAKKYKLTEKILKKFEQSQIIEIENYKNIFDKNIGDYPTEKCIILAKLKQDSITQAPANYGPTPHSYFFKTSLNCIFDCKYCYLKGAFKNNFLTIFVNYEDIKKSIKNKINEIRKSGFTDLIYFYASDYSDTLALDNITDFHANFIPFFEEFENVVMETRTKSTNIENLLNIDSRIKSENDKRWIPKNTEIAYSLNPEEIITKYELNTPSLDSRIQSINKLLDKGFFVGLRFLPLLPIENYLKIYEKFLDKILKEIDLTKINSIQVGSILYTLDDYKNILKKEKNVDFLYLLEESDDTFIRLNKKVRQDLYALFDKKISKYQICLDKK